MYEYLIRTYSNEGDTILDPCMGSGTTGIACLNTNREFIGIEKDENYYTIAEERLNSSMTVQEVAQDDLNPLVNVLY